MRIARPSVVTAVLVGGLIGLGAQSPPQGRTLVEYDFTTSVQGWAVSGDTSSTEPVFRPSGGSPGGHISNVDEALGETWYFRAPDSLLKQLAAAEHGTLSYSLKQSAEIPSVLDDDVIIVGPAGRLSYRFSASPGTDWTSFSVKLSAAAGWRWNWNAPATQEQIHSVLANPTNLEIRGEYHTGPDEGALDNVVVRSGAFSAVRRSAMLSPASDRNRRSTACIVNT
jgi:alkaline phosphatase D